MATVTSQIYLNPKSLKEPVPFNELLNSDQLSCVRLFVTPWTAAHQASLSITNSRRYPGEGSGNALQYSYLENPLDRGRLQSMHLKTVGHDWSDLAHTVEVEARPHPLLLPILVQFSSVVQSCLTLCDPMDCNTPGFPVHRQHPELAQTHVHWVGDTIQPSHLPSSPSLPAFNLSQHQGLF